MAMRNGILRRNGVDCCAIVFEVGAPWHLGVSMWPLGLTATVSLGSLRELCRSRVLGETSDALRYLCA
jgi:hypothetical protein